MSSPSRSCAANEPVSGFWRPARDSSLESHSPQAFAEMQAREADHRIKNNLQIVITLLHQQAAHARDAAAVEALKNRERPDRGRRAGPRDPARIRRG